MSLPFSTGAHQGLEVVVVDVLIKFGQGRKSGAHMYMYIFLGWVRKSGDAIALVALVR